MSFSFSYLTKGLTPETESQNCSFQVGELRQRGTVGELCLVQMELNESRLVLVWCCKEGGTF